jgi:hypothetical protein
MRKINLTPYLVKVDENGTEKPFDVKGSIYAALYHPDLKLSAMELLGNDKIAQKVKAAEGSVLLEEAEYEKIKRAFETLRGFDMNDVELVKRVLDAETVEVVEA